MKSCQNRLILLAFLFLLPDQICIGGQEQGQHTQKAIEKEMKEFEQCIRNEDLISIKDLLLQNPSILREKVGEYGSALHAAVLLCGDSNDIVAYLIEKGLNVDRKDSRGRTALHLACKSTYGRIKTVTTLVKNGADVNIVDRTGKTPLDLAQKAKDVYRIHLRIDKEQYQSQKASDIKKQLSRLQQVLDFLISVGAKTGAELKK